MVAEVGDIRGDGLWIIPLDVDARRALMGKLAGRQAGQAAINQDVVFMLAARSSFPFSAVAGMLALNE